MWKVDIFIRKGWNGKGMREGGVEGVSGRAIIFVCLLTRGGKGLKGKDLIGAGKGFGRGGDEKTAL